MSSVVIAIFLLSIGASFVQRTTGFGFGIFIMTMLPFFLPTYGEATTLSGLLAITTSAVIVWRMRNYVTWKRLWPILLTFIVVSTIAIFALTRIEDHILIQSEDQVADNEACPGRCWYTQRTDGRLLWYARPASRALFHPE